MPLIINELITTVESPAGQDQQAPISTGAEETEKKVIDVMVLSEERQERLSFD